MLAWRSGEAQIYVQAVARSQLARALKAIFHRYLPSSSASSRYQKAVNISFVAAAHNISRKSSFLKSPINARNQAIPAYQAVVTRREYAQAALETVSKRRDINCYIFRRAFSSKNLIPTLALLARVVRRVPTSRNGGESSCIVGSKRPRVEGIRRRRYRRIRGNNLATRDHVSICQAKNILKSPRKRQTLTAQIRNASVAGRIAARSPVVLAIAFARLLCFASSMSAADCRAAKGRGNIRHISRISWRMIY